MDELKHVDAESKTTCEKVKNFHNKRLLFIVIGKKVFAEVNPSGLSHIDWIKTLDITGTNYPFYELNTSKACYDVMNNCTRGYYYENNLVFYKGMNFKYDLSVLDTVKNYLDELIIAFNLKASTNIGIGVIPVKNSIFEIKYRIGTIKNLTHSKDFFKLYEKCCNS